MENVQAKVTDWSEQTRAPAPADSLYYRVAECGAYIQSIGDDSNRSGRRESTSSTVAATIATDKANKYRGYISVRTEHE